MRKSKVFWAIGCLWGLGVAASAWGALPQAGDFRETVASAKRAVFPSLVYIRVVTEDRSDGKLEKIQASGSGVLISSDGELLTNHHVVDRASRIRCQLTDGRIFPARLVGQDKDLDLALLRLEAPAGTPFAAARLSSRRLDIGEVVLAMGAPWGLARSVSMGIVSCNDRYLEDAGDYTLWYQTDAAISPGNSGGPLVDTYGEVVGLNARGNTLGDQGFTIPSTIIAELLPTLRTYGDAHWSWFGIDWQPLVDFERDITFDAAEGVVVANVDPGGPAWAAGLRPNDRVVSCDGEPVTARFREQIPDLNRRLARKPWNSETHFAYVRGGATNELTVVARSKGAVEGREIAFRRWGFTAKDINRFDTPDLAFLAPEGGVFVSSLAWDGNAENAGVRRRDILRTWGGAAVPDVEALQALYAAAMTNLANQTQVEVEVLRKGRVEHFVLNYREDPDQED